MPGEPWGHLLLRAHEMKISLEGDCFVFGRSEIRSLDKDFLVSTKHFEISRQQGISGNQICFRDISRNGTMLKKGEEFEKVNKGQWYDLSSGQVIAISLSSEMNLPSSAPLEITFIENPPPMLQNSSPENSTSLQPAARRERSDNKSQCPAKPQASKSPLQVGLKSSSPGKSEPSKKRNLVADETPPTSKHKKSTATVRSEDDLAMSDDLEGSKLEFDHARDSTGDADASVQDFVQITRVQTPESNDSSAQSLSVPAGGVQSARISTQDSLRLRQHPTTCVDSADPGARQELKKLLDQCQDKDKIIEAQKKKISELEEAIAKTDKLDHRKIALAQIRVLEDENQRLNSDLTVLRLQYDSKAEEMEGDLCKAEKKYSILEDKLKKLQDETATSANTILRLCDYAWSTIRYLKAELEQMGKSEIQQENDRLKRERELAAQVAEMSRKVEETRRRATEAESKARRRHRRLQNFKDKQQEVFNNIISIQREAGEVEISDYSDSDELIDSQPLSQT
eukprot:753378-Hanusia_phi.AAC.6